MYKSKYIHGGLYLSRSEKKAAFSFYSSLALYNGWVMQRKELNKKAVTCYYHAPSWLDPGEPSHMRIHLTTDRDSTQLNASPCMGNVEYSLTWTSLTLMDISGQAGTAR